MNELQAPVTHTALKDGASCRNDYRYCFWIDKQSLSLQDFLVKRLFFSKNDIRNQQCNSDGTRN